MFEVYGPKGILDQVYSSRVILNDYTDLLKVYEFPDSLTTPNKIEEGRI